MSWKAESFVNWHRFAKTVQSGLMLVGLLSGCASLSGSKQSVKVRSHPPGAKIYQDDELLGSTPAFVQIDRRKKPKIKLLTESHSAHEVELATSYRWKDSFFSNLAWIWSPVFVPIGMGVDLLTGSAWDIEAPPPVGLGAEAPPLPTVMRELVIAPPQISNPVTSDELAHIVERQAKERYPNVVVRPHDSSVEVFERYDYLSDNKTEAPYRGDLYRELKLTHLAETKVKESDEFILLEVSVLDVYGDQVIDRFENKVPKSQVKSLNDGFIVSELKNATGLVPNNLGFNLAGYGVNIQEKGTDPTNLYVSQQIREDTLLSFLGGISLRNVKSPEVARHWKPTMRWASSIIASYRRLVFERPTASELNGVSFGWYSLGAGIGPELGLQLPVGYIYFDLIPLLSASGVVWDHGGENSDWRGTLNFEVELGYLLFVTNNVNLRLFANVISANIDQWDTVLTKATGRDFKTQSAAAAVAGFSIGYYWPEVRTWARRLAR